MRVPRILLLSLLCSLLAGCGTPKPTVSYDKEKNRTSFQTGTMTVAQDVTGSSFSTTSLGMQATAECSGRNCTPSTVRLIFEVQGSSEFALSNRSVAFVADGNEYVWSNEAKWNVPSDVRTSRGQVVKLTMPLSKLEKIVEASSLEGNLGGKSLRLEGRVQSRLKAFVQTAKNPTASSSETS